MTARELATLAHSARKAGAVTLIELQLLAELIERGEATFVSLTHSLGISLEMVAHTLAGLHGRKLVKTIICKQVLGYSIAHVTADVETKFREVLQVPVSNPLRQKQLGLRLTR